MSENDLGGFLSSVRREPLSMAVARQLREAILSGALKRGTQLPSEQLLCERLGVGRSTVREALRILQAQGLLTGGDHVSTKGPVVGGGELPVAAEALHTLVAIGEIPVEDLVDLRLVLEAWTTRAACSPSSEEALEEAEQAVALGRASIGDAEAFLRADVAFHCALAAASGNRALVLVMGVLRQAMASVLRDGLAGFDDPRPVLAQLAEEHAEILSAIRSGRPDDAAQLVRDHLTDFYLSTPESGP